MSIHLKNLLENNLHSPMFIRGLPPHQHTHNHCVGTRNHCVGQYSSSGVTPLPINTHNHCVGTRNHCVGQYTSKNYWITTSRVPCLPGAGTIYLKNVWKTTFIAPCLSGVSLPINTHNHCVGTRNHCVGQYTYKNTPAARYEYCVLKIARDILILIKGSGGRGP